MTPPACVTVDEIKSALRDRHPATIRFGTASYAPGPWTTIEEWMNIDFLALSSWKTPPLGGVGVSNPIVGYEIKVSRADYRRELRAPAKRAIAVAFCNAFYFAVPDGLLKADEVAYDPPAWTLDHDAWQRKPCRFASGGADVPSYRADPGPCYRGKRSKMVEGPLREHVTWREVADVRCEGCGGRGYSEKSRVEVEAPTLWVPADVGLVILPADGPARVIKKSPIRIAAPPVNHPLGTLADDRSSTRLALAQLARWISVRPDPRHAEVGRDGAMP